MRTNAIQSGGNAHTTRVHSFLPPRGGAVLPGQANATQQVIVCDLGLLGVLSSHIWERMRMRNPEKQFQEPLQSYFRKPCELMAYGVSNVSRGMPDRLHVCTPPAWEQA